MTAAKQASPLLDALIVSFIAWPFLGAMLLATLPESVAFWLRFRRNFGSTFWALLRANSLSCALGASSMLVICLGVYRVDYDSWAGEFEAAFSAFYYQPWLQLYGMSAWLGFLLLLATPLEHRILSRSSALADVDPAELLAFGRRVHYVTFSVLALLWLWRCWDFALHPPRY